MSRVTVARSAHHAATSGDSSPCWLRPSVAEHRHDQTCYRLPLDHPPRTLGVAIATVSGITAPYTVEGSAGQDHALECSAVTVGLFP